MQNNLIQYIDIDEFFNTCKFKKGEESYMGDFLDKPDNIISNDESLELNEESLEFNGEEMETDDLLLIENEKQINVVKFELLRSLLERILLVSDEDIVNKKDISFKLAFNTLAHYKIIKTEYNEQ